MLWCLRGNDKEVEIRRCKEPDTEYDRIREHLSLGVKEGIYLQKKKKKKKGGISLPRIRRRRACDRRITKQEDRGAEMRAEAMKTSIPLMPFRENDPGTVLKCGQGSQYLT